MRKFFVFLLILSMLLPYTVFAAPIEKSTVSNGDAIAAMWDELYAAEKRSLSDAENAKLIADAVVAHELYVDDTLRWNGDDHFTFETTTGITCGYSARLRKIGLDATRNEAALAEPDVQTQSYARKGQSVTDVYLIEPYYGIDSDFSEQYQTEAASIAMATGGNYHLYMREAATVDAIADAIEQGAVVIFDSHGETDFARGSDYTSGATTSYILLQSGEGLSDKDYELDPVSDNYHAVNYGSDGAGMYFYAVDGTCIANHMDRYAPNSLLWMAMCLSMATDGLHAPLREKGVEVAYGYSQSVTFEYDYAWEEVFYENLKAGETIATSVKVMKDEVGAWDHCHEYTNPVLASRYDCAFPIVVSSVDVYPGHGNVDTTQTVYSEWTLDSAAVRPEHCDHPTMQTEVKDPTCTESGYEKTYCAVCGTVFSFELKAAFGHNYIDGVCSDCGKEQCPHLFSYGNCESCGAFILTVGDTKDFQASSTETDFSDYSWRVSDPTLAELSGESIRSEYVDGAVTYYCEVILTALAEGEVTLTLYDKMGEAWGSATIVIFEEACEHEWFEGIFITEPTCTESGLREYFCLKCHKTTTMEIAAFGHNYSETVISLPDCAEEGVTKFECSSCGDIYQVIAEPLGHHIVSDQCSRCKGFCLVVGQTLSLCADFYDDSYTDYTWCLRDSAFAKLDNPRYTESMVGDKLVTYFYIDIVGIAAGKTEIFLRNTEGQEFLNTKLYILPDDVHFHNYTPETIEPTCTEDGYTTYTCECSESYFVVGKSALGHSYVSGVCSVCGAKASQEVSNPFTDVTTSDYFYSPVLWAVSSGITNGTSATTFSPNDPCTRGQIVTFLWRACGSPEPTKTDNPFADVSADEYYYKAVLWAVENGITTGLSATSFAPNATCTRGQVATFLWRSQNKPLATSSENPFDDITPEDYYFDAVLWAVENNVTQGVGDGKFAPEASCTRGQIVTFLYRAIA